MNIGFEKINVFHDGGDDPFAPGKVIIESLERGFSHTIGNALRRILLSSMPGASVVGLKMPGVVHEFSSISGAATDTIELILNLKKLRFDLDGMDDMYTVRFEKSAPGLYTAAALDLPTGVRIMNPEQELINVTGDQPVEFEIYVKMGRGFVDASLHKDFEDRPDVIPVDGMFSPIVNVGYTSEQMRLGEHASNERLILTITTDGSISPKDAVMLASKIAHSHFALFEGMSDLAEKTEIYKEKEEEENRILDLPIEHLELSVRSYNCLKNDGMLTVREIIKIREDQLYTIKNLGKKSVEEIVQKINDLGLEFRKS